MNYLIAFGLLLIAIAVVIFVPLTAGHLIVRVTTGRRIYFDFDNWGAGFIVLILVAMTIVGYFAILKAIS